MERYINTEQFLTSSDCIKEPIDEVCDKLDNANSKKIIVFGGRGVGKSLVLFNSEARRLGTRNQCMFTRFDSVGLFSSGLSNIFNDFFYSHYYEIVLSYKLLGYIKKYYNINDLSETERLEFINFENKLKIYGEEMDKYINNVCFDDGISLSRTFASKELTEPLLSKIKDIIGVDTFSIAIDRFDWTNSNNKISQDVLSKYFDMFDRVIITTDDDSLQKQGNRKKLHKNGYDFIDVSYGKNPKFIKEVVENKLKKCNQNIFNLEFNYNNISNDIYQRMIDDTNGNISRMLRTTSHAYDTYQWECGEWDVNKCLEFALSVDEEQNKQLKKIIRSPKLYL